MFAKHGDLIIRVWPGVLVAWIGVVIAASMMAPPLSQVVETQEFAFLPSNSPSHVAERLFRQAFPKKLVPSRVVIVVRRHPDLPEKLQDRDFDWIDDGVDESDPDRDFELRERLLRIAEEAGGLADSDEERDQPKAAGPKAAGSLRSSISAVRTWRDRTLGRLLRSQDGKATLVLVDLTTDFLDSRNQTTVAASAMGTRA